MKIPFLIFILNYLQARIIELKDEIFDNLVKTKDKDSFSVIFFHSVECPQCEDAYKIFEKSGEKLDKKRYKFYKIDCIQNIYTCLRFNITQLPSILILENGYYYQDNNYLTDYSFLNFLNEEKNTENGKKIPDPYNYIDIFFKSLNDIFSSLNRYMRTQLFKYFGIRFQWDNYHSIILILSSIILVTFCEFLLLSCCLKKKVMKKTHIDTDSYYSNSDSIKQKCS